MMTVRPRYTESNVPKNLMVRVVHLHDGNSTKRDRNGYAYATICTLVDRSTKEEVACAYTFCSKKDVPNRKTGRMVAVGRALKAYYDTQNVLHNIAEASS